MDSLLNRCQVIALKLRLIKLPCALLAVISALCLAYFIFNPSEQYAIYERASLVIALWSALVALFIYTFAQVPLYDSSASWWQRTKCRITQVAYLALVLIIVAITLALLFISLRFLRV